MVRHGQGIEGRQLCNQVVLIFKPCLLDWVGCLAAGFVAVERALDQYWRSSLAAVLVRSYPFLHPTCSALFGSPFITHRISPFVVTLFPCLSLILVKCLSLMVQSSFARLNQTSTEQLQTLFGLLLLLLFGFGFLLVGWVLYPSFVLQGK